MQTPLVPQLPHYVRFSPYPSPSVSPDTMTPADRKFKKPLMERMRRERMNRSLDWLKEFHVLRSPQANTKLEKADILELTVSYLKDSGSKDKQGISHEDGLQHYRMGVEQALATVSRAIGTLPASTTEGLVLLNQVNASIMHARLTLLSGFPGASPQCSVPVSPEGSCSSPSNTSASSCSSSVTSSSRYPLSPRSVTPPPTTKDKRAMERTATVETPKTTMWQPWQ